MIGIPPRAASRETHIEATGKRQVAPTGDTCRRGRSQRNWDSHMLLVWRENGAARPLGKPGRRAPRHDPRLFWPGGGGVGCARENRPRLRTTARARASTTASHIVTTKRRKPRGPPTGKLENKRWSLPAREGSSPGRGRNGRGKERSRNTLPHGRTRKGPASAGGAGHERPHRVTPPFTRNAQHRQTGGQKAQRGVAEGWSGWGVGSHG